MSYKPCCMSAHKRVRGASYSQKASCAQHDALYWFGSGDGPRSNLPGSGIFVRLRPAASEAGEPLAANATVECWGPAFMRGAPCAAVHLPLSQA